MDSTSDYFACIDKFTGKFYKETVGGVDNKDKNVVLSALSANVVLSMVALGAQDETKQELCDALCIEDIESVKPSIKMTIEELNSVKGVTLKLANKVYIKLAKNGELDSVEPIYRSSVEDIFKSEIEQINFAENVTTAAKINGWVEVKTHNRIKDLIDPSSLTSDTAAVLVNAIYFKGNWAHKFQSTMTKEEDFHLSDGTTLKVDMMNQKKKFFYMEIPELDAKVVTLPYENPDLSMVIILPNNVNGIDKLESLLANGTKDYLEGMSKRDVILKLPKFKIETKINVKEVLTKLGVIRLFSADAQLRGILKGEDLYVSEAVQKAFIEVNEEGAEAAAATGAVMMLKCAMRPIPAIHFSADHPFYYQIFYKDQALFSGAFKTPKN